MLAVVRHTASMTTLDPGTALATCETALRGLMKFAYEQAYGPGWLHHVAATEVEVWRGRAEDERQARGPKGVIAVPDAGLSYANYYDLLTIAGKYWDPLAPALGKRATAMAFLDRLKGLRNSVGHSRPLNPFERDLMSGIAGQIRNQVIIYMTSQDDAGDLYPRIESVTDSFGRRIESDTANTEMAGNVDTKPYVLVHPGDQVTFECFGLDPQGRTLEWALTNPWPGDWVTGELPGASTELAWTVLDSDVSEVRTIGIHMRAVGTPYHRWGSYDHRAGFAFRVRPPF